MNWVYHSTDNLNSADDLRLPVTKRENMCKAQEGWTGVEAS